MNRLIKQKKVTIPNIFLTSILIIVAIIFVGCKKDQSSGNLNQSKTSGNVSFPQNTQTKSQILALNNDSDELRVRETKWAFGEALRNAYISDPNLVSIIVADASTSPKKEADIKRICDNNPSIKTSIANSLNAYFNTNLSENEAINSNIAKLNYNGVSFAGTIKIYNIDYLNIADYPIISSGLDVDESSGLDDGIIAYNFTSNLDYNEVNVDEEMAKITNKPLLIFGNGVKDEDWMTNVTPIEPFIIDDNNIGNYTQEVSQEDRNLRKSSMSLRRYDYLHISVKNSNYHYDGCCKNNICLSSYLINNYGKWSGSYITFGAWGSSPQLKDVIGLNKGQCNGTQFTQWGELCHPPVNQAGGPATDVFYFLPFERDWYASWKYVGPYNYNGKMLNVAYDATFPHEHYGHNLGGVNPSHVGVLVTATAANFPMWKYIDLHSFKMKFAFTRIL